jgi:hypothetical protein
MTELVKHEASAVELMRQSTDVAGVCREIVKRTARTIGNRQYVQVEGWQSIATAHGCIPTIVDVQTLTDGSIMAVAELRRIADSAVISRAEGFVGMDESTWASRPMYARRAMAQTRAMSRVCRTAFAHVVVMIDENLSTTPAEEVPDGGFEMAAQASATTAPSKPQPTTTGDKLVAVIEDVVILKEGTGAKGPWVLVGIKVAGVQNYITTFDKSWADYAKAGIGHKAEFQTKPGRKAGDLELIYMQAITTNTLAQTQTVLEEDNGDDIPFDHHDRTPSRDAVYPPGRYAGD